MTKKKYQEFETMLTAAVVSLGVSFGMILLIAVLLEENIKTWDGTIATIIYFVMAGIIWGWLIYKNH